MRRSLPVQIIRLLSLILITTCLLQVNLFAGEKLAKMKFAEKSAKHARIRHALNLRLGPL